MSLLLAVALLWLTPSTDRIDYAHPERYLALPPAVGKSADVARVASQIHGATDEAKLRALSAWMRAHLRFDTKQPNVWRDFAAILRDGTLAGCADSAVVFGVVARAVGIPTVWVKSMDVDWIREFKRDPSSPGRGHVFVESFVGGRWRLVDSTQLVIYDDYDPRIRVLPGNRLAYDKGDDPAALTLSLDGENWKKQTRAYFEKFDDKQLPVGAGRPLVRRLFVVADSPFWKWIVERGEKAGVGVGHSGNTEFDKWLPGSAGHWLVFTAVGSHVVLPSELRDRYAPLSSQQLAQALRERASGRADRLLDDGTRVILLYARDGAGLKTEIDQLSFPAD